LLDQFAAGGLALIVEQAIADEQRVGAGCHRLAVRPARPGGVVEIEPGGRVAVPPNPMALAHAAPRPERHRVARNDVPAILAVHQSHADTSTNRATDSQAPVGTIDDIEAITPDRLSNAAPSAVDPGDQVSGGRIAVAVSITRSAMRSCRRSTIWPSTAI